MKDDLVTIMSFTDSHESATIPLYTNSCFGFR